MCQFQTHTGTLAFSRHWQEELSVLTFNRLQSELISRKCIKQQIWTMSGPDSAEIDKNLYLKTKTKTMSRDFIIPVDLLSFKVYS